MWIGFGVLAINVALTIVYRTLHEYKFGTKLESGPAYETNEYVWMLLLPALCALALILPRAKQDGQLWPERAWIPMGLFGLWATSTAVHLYCLGFVYDFTLRGDLLAPTIWVIAWVIYARATVALSQQAFPLIERMERLLLILPVSATFVACWPESTKAFFALTLLNIAIYAMLAWRHRENRFVRHLALLSLAMLVAGLPETWGVKIVSNFTREKSMGIAAAGYCLLWAVRSSDLRIAILGAIVSAITALFAGGGEENALHWASQIALVFLLLHSLRWKDFEHTGTTMLRILASAFWLVHAVIWTHTTGRPWMPCVLAVTVLAFYLFARIVRRNWSSPVIPLAASLVILAGPAEIGGNKLQIIPIGLLAVIASFLLFGIGTLAALTRHRWTNKKG